MLLLPRLLTVYSYWYCCCFLGVSSSITITAAHSASPQQSLSTTTTSLSTTTTSNNMSLEKAARSAVAKYANSHVEMALAFCKTACPEFLAVENDRLVKAGRSLESVVRLFDEGMMRDSTMDDCLQPLLEECRLLAKSDTADNVVKVPKRRFGKTGLQMPVATLGTMRFQRKWGPTIQDMNQVPADCQDNLVRTLKRAICDFGMNHIETARGYGSSELQLGVALKQLMDTGIVQRKDLIIQTKVAPFAKAQDFKDTLDKSMKLLQVDYLDLFAFHGCNLPHQYGWVFGHDDEPEGNMKVVREYVKAGKIRHVGFSTHGPEDVIRKFIETDAFDYVNLHFHYFGSYTTTGVGPYHGNLGNVKLLNEKDMGVFIISPFDKGGKTWEPSNKLRSLTLPEMEPMDFGCSWLWLHHLLTNKDDGMIHTMTCGAARPSDLDQPAVYAYWTDQQQDTILSKVQTVAARMEQAMQDALGEDWCKTCYDGVPKSNVSKHVVEHNQIVWCYNLIQAFGMLGFAKNRYGSLEANRAKWNNDLSKDENIAKLGIGGWGFVPGLSIVPGVDYSDDFEKVPEKNLKRLREAEAFVHKLCKKKVEKKKEGEGTKEEEEEKEEPIPFGWQPAYDMKPWVDWPDRP